MILNQFESWARSAPASGRAAGISALARAYLLSRLDERERADALRVMTTFLDDPAASVRRALADALAAAAEAPHAIILALAEDCAGVATIVLARSPVLSDADLIECAATAEPAAQAAIAARFDLSASVAAALAEIAAPEALVALAANRVAAVPACALRRMVERHGSVPEVREALLARADLPVDVRIDLVDATTTTLAALVAGRNWMSDDRMKRVAAEAGDRATLEIAAKHADSRSAIVAHLRQSGRLTPSFAFRAILSGKIELFKAMLVELSGSEARIVDTVARRPDDAAFAALYRRCAMPPALLPAFRLALGAARDADWSRAQGGALSLDAITRVLTGCTAINDGGLDKLLVLLRRFESEAARDDARAAAGAASLDGDVSPPLTPLHLDSLVADTPRMTTDAQERRRNPFFAIDLEAIEAVLLVA